jgi:hypothetical protein
MKSSLVARDDPRQISIPASLVPDDGAMRKPVIIGHWPRPSIKKSGTGCCRFALHRFFPEASEATGKAGSGEGIDRNGRASAGSVASERREARHHAATVDLKPLGTRQELPHPLVKRLLHQAFLRENCIDPATERPKIWYRTMKATSCWGFHGVATGRFRLTKRAQSVNLDKITRAR